MSGLILTVDPWVEPAALVPLLPEFRVERAALPLAEPACIAVVTSSGMPFAAADAAALPALRVVATASVGYDHLDVAGLAARGIATYHAPAYCSDEVADHAIASLLALWRGLARTDAEQRAGQWDTPSLDRLRRIAGSTLGIVGLGRIGRALADRARALGIEVLGHDPPLGDDAIRASGAEPVGLDELLRRSDGVSLHVPRTRGAAPLIGARELALMPRHAVLVNVSRSALVDLGALADALREDRLFGAAFDVWDVEPPAPGDTRASAPSLLLTPHIAYASPAADAKLYAATAASIRAGLAGETAVGRLG